MSETSTRVQTERASASSSSSPPTPKPLDYSSESKRRATVEQTRHVQNLDKQNKHLSSRLRTPGLDENDDAYDESDEKNSSQLQPPGEETDLHPERKRPENSHLSSRRPRLMQFSSHSSHYVHDLPGPSESGLFGNWPGYVNPMYSYMRSSRETSSSASMRVPNYYYSSIDTPFYGNHEVPRKWFMNQKDNLNDYMRPTTSFQNDVHLQARTEWPYGTMSNHHETHHSSEYSNHYDRRQQSFHSSRTYQHPVHSRWFRTPYRSSRSSSFSRELSHSHGHESPKYQSSRQHAHSSSREKTNSSPGPRKHSSSVGTGKSKIFQTLSKSSTSILKRKSKFSRKYIMDLKRPQSAGAILMHSSSSISSRFAKLSLRRRREKKDAPEDPNKKALSAAADKLRKTFLASKKSLDDTNAKELHRKQNVPHFGMTQENAEDLSIKTYSGHCSFSDGLQEIRISEKENLAMSTRLSQCPEFKSGATSGKCNDPSLCDDISDDSTDEETGNRKFPLKSFQLLQRRRYASESAGAAQSSNSVRSRSRSSSVGAFDASPMKPPPVSKHDKNLGCEHPRVNKMLVKQLLTMDKKSLQELVADPRSRKAQFMVSHLMSEQRSALAQRLDLLRGQHSLENKAQLLGASCPGAAHGILLDTPSTSCTLDREKEELQILGQMEALELGTLPNNVLIQLCQILSAEQNGLAGQDLAFLSLDDLMGGGQASSHDSEAPKPTTSAERSDDCKEPLQLTCSKLSALSSPGSTSNAGANVQVLPPSSTLAPDFSHQQNEDDVEQDLMSPCRSKFKSHLSSLNDSKSAQNFLVSTRPSSHPDSLVAHRQEEASLQPNVMRCPEGCQDNTAVGVPPTVSAVSTECMSRTNTSMSSQGTDLRTYQAIERSLMSSENISEFKLPQKKTPVGLVLKSELCHLDIGSAFNAPTTETDDSLANKSCSSDMECQIVSPPPKLAPAMITIDDSDNEEVKNIAKNQVVQAINVNKNSPSSHGFTPIEEPSSVFRTPLPLQIISPRARPISNVHFNIPVPHVDPATCNAGTASAVSLHTASSVPLNSSYVQSSLSSPAMSPIECKPHIVKSPPSSPPPQHHAASTGPHSTVGCHSSNLLYMQTSSALEPKSSPPVTPALIRPSFLRSPPLLPHGPRKSSPVTSSSRSPSLSPGNSAAVNHVLLHTSIATVPLMPPPPVQQQPLHEVHLHSGLHRTLNLGLPPPQLDGLRDCDSSGRRAPPPQPAGSLDDLRQHGNAEDGPGRHASRTPANARPGLKVKEETPSPQLECHLCQQDSPHCCPYTPSPAPSVPPRPPPPMPPAHSPPSRASPAPAAAGSFLCENVNRPSSKERPRNPAPPNTPHRIPSPAVLPTPPRPVMFPNEPHIPERPAPPLPTQGLGTPRHLFKQERQTPSLGYPCCCLRNECSRASSSSMDSSAPEGLRSGSPPSNVNTSCVGRLWFFSPTLPRQNAGHPHTNIVNDIPHHHHHHRHHFHEPDNLTAERDSKILKRERLTPSLCRGVELPSAWMPSRPKPDPTHADDSSASIAVPIPDQPMNEVAANDVNKSMLNSVSVAVQTQDVDDLAAENAASRARLVSPVSDEINIAESLSLRQSPIPRQSPTQTNRMNKSRPKSTNNNNFSAIQTTSSSLLNRTTATQFRRPKTGVLIDSAQCFLEELGRLSTLEEILFKGLTEIDRKTEELARQRSNLTLQMTQLHQERNDLLLRLVSENSTGGVTRHGRCSVPLMPYLSNIDERNGNFARNSREINRNCRNLSNREAADSSISLVSSSQEMGPSTSDSQAGADLLTNQQVAADDVSIERQRCTSTSHSPDGERSFSMQQEDIIATFTEVTNSDSDGDASLKAISVDGYSDTGSASAPTSRFQYNPHMNVRVTRKRSKSTSESIEDSDCRKANEGNNKDAIVCLTIPDTTQDNAESSGLSVGQGLTANCKAEMNASHNACRNHLAQNCIMDQQSPNSDTPSKIFLQSPKSRNSSGSDHSYSLRSRGPPEGDREKHRRSVSHGDSREESLTDGILSPGNTILGLKKELTEEEQVVEDGNEEDVHDQCLSAASSVESLDCKMSNAETHSVQQQHHRYKRKRRSRKHSFCGPSSSKRKKLHTSPASDRCEKKTSAANSPLSSRKKSSVESHHLFSSPDTCLSKKTQKHKLTANQREDKNDEKLIILPPPLKEPVLDIKIVGDYIFTCSNSSIRCFHLLTGAACASYVSDKRNITALAVVGTPHFTRAIRDHETNDNLRRHENKGGERDIKSGCDVNKTEGDFVSDVNENNRGSDETQRGGNRLNENKCGHSRPEAAVGFKDSSFEVITGSTDGTLCVYDGHKGSVLQSRAVEGAIRCVAAAWGHVFCGMFAGQTARWGYKSGGGIAEVDGCSSGPVNLLECHREGCRRVLVMAARNSPILVRDAFSGLLLRSLEAVQHSVYRVLFLGGQLYTAGSRSIVLYDYASGEKKQKLSTESDVCSLAASSQHLLACCYDANIRVYCRQTGALVRVLKVEANNKLLICSAVYRHKVLVGSKGGDIVSVDLP